MDMIKNLRLGMERDMKKKWMVMKKMSVFEFSFSGLCTVKYSESSQDQKHLLGGPSSTTKLHREREFKTLSLNCLMNMMRMNG